MSSVCLSACPSDVIGLKLQIQVIEYHLHHWTIALLGDGKITAGCEKYEKSLTAMGYYDPST